MIRAVWTAPCSLTITGHAGYAEKGKDIVCAGVSTLWGTLAAELEDRAWNGEGELHLTGDTIAFIAENPAEIQRVFAMIWRGLLLLAGRYGEYIDAERTW
jgi:uncharacterized protein YsxB (DUF464 family)